MSLRLHVFPPSPRAFKVLVVAHHLGIDYEFVLCDLTKGDQKSAAYAALNPNQRMPSLEDGDFRLWESNAIIQYLAAKKPEGELLPADERARADRRAHQCGSEQDAAESGDGEAARDRRRRARGRQRAALRRSDQEGNRALEGRRHEDWREGPVALDQRRAFCISRVRCHAGRSASRPAQRRISP